MNESDATQHYASDVEGGASNAEDRESRIEWKPYRVRKEQSSTCEEEEELTNGLIGKEKEVCRFEWVLSEDLLWVGTVSRCTITWWLVYTEVDCQAWTSGYWYWSVHNVLKNESTWPTIGWLWEAQASRLEIFDCGPSLNRKMKKKIADAQST